MAHYRNQTIWLPELFREGNRSVENAYFLGCTLTGPAILLPSHGTVIVDCTWNGNPNAIAWEIDPARVGVIGALAFVESNFQRCTFIDVGYAQSPDMTRQFMEATTIKS